MSSGIISADDPLTRYTHLDLIINSHTQNSYKDMKNWVQLIERMVGIDGSEEMITGFIGDAYQAYVLNVNLPIFPGHEVGTRFNKIHTHMIVEIKHDSFHGRTDAGPTIRRPDGTTPVNDAPSGLSPKVFKRNMQEWLREEWSVFHNPAQVTVFYRVISGQHNYNTKERRRQAMSS